MSLSLFIARRIYRESDSGKQVSRPAVLIAMAGIAIGLAVMIIAVAVVIGFKSEVRNKVIGFGSHIQITNLDAVSSYETHPIVVGDSMMTALDGYRYRLRFHTLYLPAYHSLSAEAPPLSPAPAANRSNDSPN